MVKIYIDGLDGVGKTKLLNEKKSNIWHSTNKTPHNINHYYQILGNHYYNALDRGFLGNWTFRKLFKNNNNNYYDLTPKFSHHLKTNEILSLAKTAYLQNWIIIIINVDYQWLKYLYDSKPNQKLPFDEWKKIAGIWDDLVVILRKHKVKFVYYKIRNPVMCRVSWNELDEKIYNEYKIRLK